MTSTKPILKSQKSGSAISSNPNVTGGSNGSSSGNNLGGNGGGSQGPPSPWLMPEVPNPHPSASFVEYLRWMREVNREPDNRTGKDPTDPATKVQILQLAQEKANYTERLKVLTKRTKLIAGEGNWFEVTCPWRIRVGGIRGVESMLIPAFDALGMPYIPSSTLRGVARNAAIREFMQEEGLDWKAAEKMIAPYFGSIDTKNPKDSMGKVIFLDAYPMPSKDGGLSVDIANNIWKWDGDSIGKYSPNPNPFLSLKESEFVIGLRVSSTGNQQVLDRVRKWLVKGLQNGVGSQVNSGYGVLEISDNKSIEKSNHFLEIEFGVEGQLIHGVQKFQNLSQPYTRNKEGNLKPDTKPTDEIRSIAFKSMLRYWFRVFALGVLPPNGEHGVKSLEMKLFGGIEPQAWGWLSLRVKKIKESPLNNQQSGIQDGILRLFTSSSVTPELKESVEKIYKELTWLMFRLGGVGQGARRPCYKRNGNPPYRGSKLTPYSSDRFWQIQDDPKEFQLLFQQRLTSFYSALRLISSAQINGLRNINGTTSQNWNEVADANCRILVYQGDNRNRKTHALAVLHSQEFNKNPLLCGQVRPTVNPSPVWIADAEDKDYQVVTVFGATQEPRKKFVQKLRDQGAIQIFPMT